VEVERWRATKGRSKGHYPEEIEDAILGRNKGFLLVVFGGKIPALL